MSFKVVIISFLVIVTVKAQTPKSGESLTSLFAEAEKQLDERRKELFETFLPRYLNNATMDETRQKAINDNSFLGKILVYLRKEWEGNPIYGKEEIHDLLLKTDPIMLGETFKDVPNEFQYNAEVLRMKKYFEDGVRTLKSIAEEFGMWP